MSKAVFITGGKQYRVAQGDLILVEKLEGDVSSSITFDKVLAAGEGSDLRIGAPYLEGASVTAEVVEQLRAPKVIAFKFRRRKGYAKKKGHRQQVTKLKITGISA